MRYTIPLAKKIQVLESLRRKNLNDTAIAKNFGVSQPFVSAIRKELGLPAIGRQKPYEHISLMQRALIIGLLRRGNFNDHRIARRVGVNPDTAFYWRKKLHLQSFGGQYSKFKLKRVLALRKKGLTYEKIAEIEGVDKVNLKKLLDKARKL